MVRQPGWIACLGAWGALGASLGGCADEAALRAERDRLEAELLRREVVLADLDDFRAEVALLDRRVAAMRAQLEELNVPLLAAGLVEQQATGWLEEREGPDRVVIEGSGDASSAAAALELASGRAGGLKVASVQVGPGRWRAECSLSEPLPRPPPSAPEAELELPTWPFAGALVDEIETLRARVAEADARIGVDLHDLEQRRWEATLLVHRLSEPDRLARVEPVVASLFGGAVPLVPRGELVVGPAQLSGKAQLRPGASREDLLAALTAHGAAEVDEADDGMLLFSLRPGG